MSDILDGYKLFFDNFPEVTHEKMLNFGIESLISVQIDTATQEWDRIKKDLNSNKKLFIRGYGRDAAGTDLYFNLYNKLFSNENIRKDATNNYNPTKCILEWTNTTKNKITKKQVELGTKQIQNFQISHVFGNTKNPLLFTAPWNIIILPKIMDPFTGHEAKGKLKDDFSKILQKHTYTKYKELIEDYNKIANDKLRDEITCHVNEMKNNSIFKDNNLDKFLVDALSEWKQIKL
jgi:hypothetical protein